jgi:superfamily II DNA or RNA helicase
MALQFGSSYKDEFFKFDSLTSKSDFEASVLPFIQFTQGVIQDAHNSKREEVLNWRVELFNEDRHFLRPHQVKAIEGCLQQVVLTADIKSGYCFMPTSAGKGHILITLAALAIGDFRLFKDIEDAMPGSLREQPYLIPILTSLSLLYAKLIQKSEIKRTQILVHDIEILKQLRGDASSLLGEDLADKIQFHSVQALGNEIRRENLKYVIIDECHWGNATQQETIQSDLVNAIKESGGSAFGFTASPYQHPDGKFQKTWSKNKINSEFDFNYYLDNEIVYPVTLREVNLQNARPDFADSGEELDLTEKAQVVEFMANHIMTVLPENELDGPGICYFSPVIIPDMVEQMLSYGPKSKILKGRIKVLASESAEFAEKCKSRFGESILATAADIDALKRGEKIFLVSAMKLIVGLNAPYLKYVFISPTNSKIKIMQAIGRLMRPVGTNIVSKKLATLFLTSLTGKKLDIGEGIGEPDVDNAPGEPIEIDPDADETPQTRYATYSMTLSEAYDLPNKVFYKNEVGFRDFINERLISNPNAVDFVSAQHIDKDALDNMDVLREVRDLKRLRDLCRSQYRDYVMWKRDKGICQGKTVLGSDGCSRAYGEVNLEVHHMPPWEFKDIVRKFGPDGALEWHRNSKNMEHLVTLCIDCHDMFHAKEAKEKKRERA